MYFASLSKLEFYENRDHALYLFLFVSMVFSTRFYMLKKSSLILNHLVCPLTNRILVLNDMKMEREVISIR